MSGSFVRSFVSLRKKKGNDEFSTRVFRILFFDSCFSTHFFLRFFDKKSRKASLAGLEKLMIDEKKKNTTTYV